MSISYKLLGKPGKDNALFVIINSGSKYYRLLFDCGEGIFETMDQNDIKNIDYLFLSHLHIDHIAGFDFLFRRIYDREKPVFIFGPELTINILQNRLCGFRWNLVDDSDGRFVITEICNDKILHALFFTKEGFKIMHRLNKNLGSQSLTDKKLTTGMSIVLQNNDFTVTSGILNHSIPSLAYNVTEKQTMKINIEKLNELNLKPGPWLEEIRSYKCRSKKNIIIDGKIFSIKNLREKLLSPKDFDSIAYLTDFVFDKKSKTRAIKIMKGCKTVICESQYLSQDESFAKKNFHLISKRAALLAREADIEKLILFHISDRYRINSDYKIMLSEAREIFPNTFFPGEWELELDT